MSTLRRVFGIAVSWAVLWLALWGVLAGMTALIDPDSIDPGEGFMVWLAVLGPMGLLSGIAIGVLLTVGSNRTPILDLRWFRVAGWGFLGCMFVQTVFLDHGDQGLLANLQLALMFSVIGAALTVVWLSLTRWWFRRTASSPSA